MKWINLSERQPTSLNSVHLRPVSEPKELDFIRYRFSYADDGVKVHLVPLEYKARQQVDFYLKELEWLDETEDKDEGYSFLDVVREGKVYNSGVHGKVYDPPKSKLEWYIGMREPDGNPRGSGYWIGTIWAEKSDGNFIRIDKPASIKSTHLNGTETYVGMSVRRDTFLSYVDKGWLKKLDEDSAAEFVGKNKNSEVKIEPPTRQVAEDGYILAQVKVGSFIIPPQYVSEIPPDLLNKILTKASKGKLVGTDIHIRQKPNI